MVMKIEGFYDILVLWIDIVKYLSYGKLLCVIVRIFL